MICYSVCPGLENFTHGLKYKLLEFLGDCNKLISFNPAIKKNFFLTSLMALKLGEPNHF